MIKKFSAQYALVRFIKKIFVSRSFDLYEGHWESEKHVVMLVCLCTALLREEDETHCQNGETLNQSHNQVLL